MQLYDFKLQNPDADVQAYLNKSSQFFQNYVERGLKGIEAQRLRSGQQTATAAASATDRDRAWRQAQFKMRKDAEREWTGRDGVGWEWDRTGRNRTERDGIRLGTMSQFSDHTTPNKRCYC